MDGNSNTIIVKSGASLVATGTADIVDVVGAATSISVASATVNIENGGMAVDTFASSDTITVSSGGTLELLGSSTLSGVTISSGANLEIGSGYTLSSYVIALVI